jgi:acetyl esterase/lipase
MGVWRYRLGEHYLHSPLRKVEGRCHYDGVQVSVSQLATSSSDVSRLAPEAPWPAAIHDSWEAFLWATSQGKKRLNLDTSRVAISGASAGANIAAVIAQKAAVRKLPRVTLRSQVLVVPATDNTVTPSTSPDSSWKTMEYTAHLPAKKMLWYRRHYLPNQSDWCHPEASPLLASDEVFRELPPACIIVAELDVLRSEGEEYSKRLEENGVKTELTVMEGMPHAFLAMDAVLETGRTGITKMCEALTEAFA